MRLWDFMEESLARLLGLEMREAWMGQWPVLTLSTRSVSLKLSGSSGQKSLPVLEGLFSLPKLWPFCLWG